MTALLTHFFFEGGFFYLTLFIIALMILAYALSGVLFSRIRQTLQSQKLFVENAAHELRSPIATMQLRSETALKGAGAEDASAMSEEASRELIDALRDDLAELEAMSNIIKNLSLMASYGYGHGGRNMGPVDLNALLRRLSEVVSGQLTDGKQITLQNTDTAPLLILGNESALEQMILNLLSNAVKYSNQEGHVLTSLFATQEEVVLSVKDKGIGIAKKDQRRIFKPLFRSADVATGEREGSGLGLAIVGEIAREHQAKISVHSAVGRGTEIFVRFPVLAK